VSVVAVSLDATNVSGKFWALAFTPVILNFCIIIGCFFIDNNLIIRSLPLAVATVFAGILELLFMILIIRKFNIMKINKTKGNEDDFGNKNKIKFYLKKTWVKFLPAAFGAGILQLNLLVDTILASLLGFGSVSFLYFADRIAQLPLGIIGIALGSVLLTSLSKEYAKKNKKNFSNNLIISLKIGLFFSIPTAVAFISFPELFVTVLFESGEFTSLETTQTSHALVAYSLGIPAFIMLKSCQPAFFAEGDTKTPLYIGIILLMLNIFLSILFMHYWEHAGIALATSVVSWIGVVIYIFLLIKDGKILRPINNQSNKYISYNTLLIYFFKILMISLLMIGLMQLLFYFSSIYQINDILILSLLVTSGLLIYVLTTFVLGYIPQQLLNFYISKFEKAK